MEDESLPSCHGIIEEFLRQFLFVVVVDGIVNVTAVEFVLKSTIDDDRLLAIFIVNTIQDVDERLVIDPRQIVSILYRHKMRKLWSRAIFQLQAD